ASLGDLLKKKSRLAAEEAAGYVVQAARGLLYAHERGMVHRDVKPDNLMLNKQGVVKVADLGLVRTPGASEERPAGAAAPAPKKGKQKVASQGTLSSLGGVTMVNQAMGTPAYMAPEQGRDASTVDHRADLYSLGCTLYVLVTGQTVFSGKTALEVIEKHRTEEVVRPEAVNEEVPPELSAIIVKLLAKSPDERYADAAELIAALEGYLEQSGMRTRLGEEQAAVLEEGVKAFAAAPLAKARRLALPAAGVGWAALVFGLLLSGAWSWAGAFVGLGAATALAHFVVR